MEQFFLDFANAISPALQTLLQGIFALLAAQAVGWMKKQYDLKKSELSREQQYLLELVASHAVQAAEQMYDDGYEKKREAIINVQKSLEQYGVKLDVGLIVTAVESAVFMKNQNQVEPSPVDFHLQSG